MRQGIESNGMDLSREDNLSVDGRDLHLEICALQDSQRFAGYKCGDSGHCDQSQTLTPERSSLLNFLRCIGCFCRDCNQNKRTYEEIKTLFLEKLEVKIVEVPATAKVNLCESPEMVINYT